MLCFESVLTDLERPVVEKRCLDSRMTSVYANSLALDSADLAEGLKRLRSQRDSRH